MSTTLTLIAYAASAVALAAIGAASTELASAWPTIRRAFALMLWEN